MITQLLNTILTNVPLLLSREIAPTQYLDPGSGSFLLQLLIGSLLGAAFIFRSTLSKIKNLFTKKSGDDINKNDRDSLEN
jgi:hypothetical protein